LTKRQHEITQGAAERAAAPRRAADNLQRMFTEPTAAMEMRVFGAVDELDARADDLWRQVRNVKLAAAVRSAATAAFGWAVLGLGYLGALAYVAVLANRGDATPGDVVMVAQLALALRGNLAQTSNSLRQTLDCLRVTDRYLWLLDEADQQAQKYSGAQ